MTHKDIHQLTALRVMRADANALTPAAARIAVTYLPIVTLDDDLWRSAINKTLVQRAADVDGLLLAELVSLYGRPGAWRTSAYRNDDVSDARFYLAGVAALAREYVPHASTVC